MPHRCARLVAVAIAAVSFSTPITAQQEPTPQEVADIRVRAEQGEAEAQFSLGLMYEEGPGKLPGPPFGARWDYVPTDFPQDYGEAVVWYRRAADQGHARAQLYLGYMYEIGGGVSQDYAEAVTWYRKATAQGLAEAQNYLGNQYYWGRVVPEDHSEAVVWYRRAADQGFAEAQVNLGRMYSEGLGVLQDDVEAVVWYRRAAEQGHVDAQLQVGYDYLGTIYGIAPLSTPIAAQQKPTPQEVADIRVRAEQGEAEAQYQLGKMYEVGRGIAGNLAEAVVWYRRAADQGDMRAQYELGSRYQSGDNIPQDRAQATVWIRRAADQGHPRAQLRLGYRQAVEGFRSAAEQGDAEAQSTLGELYRLGGAVPRDHAQAVAWYRRAAVSFRQAAEQGDAEAQYDLGRLIDDTETYASIGLPNLWSGANPADSSSCDYCPLLESWAFAWYLSAAKQGYAEAQRNVAYMYYAGNGVREDRAEAEAWYRRAAEQEHVFSQNSLAALYERGDGIPQDDAEAVVWYRRAAEQSSVLAAENLAEMYAEGRGVPLEELEQLRQDVAEVFQQLAEFPNVQAIRIEDDWRGFGSISSREAHYALERRSDGFEGPGVLSVASWSNGQQEALVDVVVPLDVVQGFLRMLAGSPLDQSIYLPSRGMTDNYPSTKIELDLETDTVVFFTTSQGAGGIPWGLTLKDVTFVPAAYVINSDIPMGALETLGPYLEREVLASLIDQVQGR